MKCPACNETLLMSDKNGIEIDYCPNCRGIWLDRGELDKIIERSSNQNYSKANNDNFKVDREHRGNDYDQRNSNYKKKSFLGEIFDF